MPLIEQAPAKINLTLRVLGRRADGYHALESLVAFADFGDRLTLEPGEAVSLTLSGELAGACGPERDNLVLKAHAALAAHIAGLRGGRFTLEKNIPVAAGLGGGSADAAAALRLLAAANEMAAGDPRVYAAARSTGADVAVCLDMQPRVMHGIGDELSRSLILPKLDAVLVNPGVALATKDVFAAFEQKHAGDKPLGDVPTERAALLDWLDGHGNDLTQAATSRTPVIGEVLAALKAQPGCRLARMSGSGATCFGLFKSAGDAGAAAAALRRAQPKWWIRQTVLN